VYITCHYQGTVFFEYHKTFSARSAALLLNKCIHVDWSIRDHNIYTTVCSGLRTNACSLCQSCNHL